MKQKDKDDLQCLTTDCVQRFSRIKQNTSSIEIEKLADVAQDLALVVQELINETPTTN